MALLERGIYLGPSGYEVGFISQAHTKEILTEAGTALRKSLIKSKETPDAAE